MHFDLPDLRLFIHIAESPWRHNSEAVCCIATAVV